MARCFRQARRGSKIPSIRDALIRFAQTPLALCSGPASRWPKMSIAALESVSTRARIAVFESYCKEKLAPLTLRLALGLACLYHGFLKIQASGGSAWAPSLPAGWQFLIAWGEFVAGLALVFGCHCRLGAGLALVINIWSFLWWQGWSGLHLPLRSLEPFVLVVLIGLSVVFLGAGGLSLDARSGVRPTFAKAGKKK